MLPPKEIGFSGTRNGFDHVRAQRVGRFLLDEFEPGAKFHHGCCIGSDVQAAAIASLLGYIIVAHPPIKADCLAPIEQWCADEIREPKSYFARNRDIVDETITLLATPPTIAPVEGGTWYTIGYATKRGKLVQVISP